jgi:tetratricopeptide (TPR) repeat protein
MISRPLAVVLASTLLLSTNSVLAASNGSATGTVSNRAEMHIRRGAPTIDDLSEVQTHVAKHPEDTHARFILGLLLAMGGYQNLAREQFDAVEKVQPGTYIREFHKLLKENYEAALPVAFYADEHFKEDGGLLYMRGRQYLSKGMKRAATENFNKALQAKPVWPATYRLISQFAFSESRRDEAIKYADKALQIDPNDTEAKAVKTAALAELTGHPENYLGELEKYAARNWSNDSLSLDLAQAYINKKQYAKAVKPLLYTLKYGNVQRVKKAQELLKRVMQKDAGVPAEQMLAALDEISPLNTKDYMSTVVRMRFARCLSDIGAHRPAIKVLLQALQQHSYFAPALNFRLGEEYLAVQDDDSALFFFQTAHQMRPDDEEYAAAVERVNDRITIEPNDIARKLKKMIRGAAEVRKQ